MSLAAIAPIAGSLLGGLFGGGAAKKAAKAQAEIGRQQLDLQKGIYQDTTKNLAPWLNGGNLGQQAYLYEMGLGAAPTFGGTAAPAVETVWGGGSGSNPNAPRMEGMAGGGAAYAMSQGAGNKPSITGYRVGGQTFATMQEAQAYANSQATGGTQYQGYQKTPGYDFRLNQGMDTIESTAAARGGLYSGAALQGALQFGQDYATGEYNNYLNRLQGISASGQNAAAQQGAVAANYANSATNSLSNIGNAQSAGYIGQASALNKGIENSIGAFQYQNVQPNPTNKAGGSNWLFGGNSWG